jgi:glucose-6-phosphate isomerase
MIKTFYSRGYKSKLKDFSKKEIPAFAKYSPNIKLIKSQAQNYKKYKNIIIAARGGSITSFYAYFGALNKGLASKNVYFVDTADPDYLYSIKKSCSKKDTLLIVISKSGKTIDVIENYLYFSMFDSVFVTTPDDNPLYKIAQKRGIFVIPHPEIGGRYSGLTATALLPAYLVGIDIDKLASGAKKAYIDFGPSKKNNDALRVASWLYEYDKKGFVDIYNPIYSTALKYFSELIMQLIHESVGKDGMGPSIIPVSAPESQHHSNQRYFGGKKNIQGLFIYQNDFSRNEKLTVPKDISSIPLRGHGLSVINNLELKKAMAAEFAGTFEDSIKRKVPALCISVGKIDERAIGYFTGFLHYLTVYLSWLNNVNPFDQPEVETSKEISFKKRIS